MTILITKPLTHIASEYSKNGYVNLIYSRSQIKKTGEKLRKLKINTLPDSELADCLDIIRNYRASHLYPLIIIKNLTWKKLQKVNKKAILAGRLKRLPTILDKITRETLDGITKNSISLERMRDIAGCRAILSNKREVELFIGEINNSTRSKHTIVKQIDYNQSPRESGYRGVHVIYKSFGKDKSHEWYGFHVELQVRTELQHLWATTIEVVDLFQKQKLKFTQKNDSNQWFYFFQLMSKMLADDDGFERLDFLTKKHIKQELIRLDNELKIRNNLISFNTYFSKHKSSDSKNNIKYVVILLKYHEKVITVEQYSDKKKAIESYSIHEINESVNALFVEMDDFKKLSIAYPNYIIDTRKFIEFLDKYQKNTY